MTAEFSGSSLALKLTQLEKLRAGNALTDGEFETIKARLLELYDSQTETVRRDNSVGLNPRVSKSGSPDFLMRDVLRPEVLVQFVGEKSLSYYTERFGDLIQAANISDMAVSEVGSNEIGKAFRWGRLPFKKLLPFAQGSQFNWAAFFLTVFWGAWRGVAYIWWLVGLWLLIVVFDFYFEEYWHSSLLAKAGVGLGGVFAIQGNSLFLGSIVRSLNSGDLTAAKPSMGRVYATTAVFVLSVGAMTLISGGVSGEIDKCNSNQVKNTILASTVENLKRNAIAKLEKMPADKEGQLMIAEFQNWSATIKNVRQQNYDRVNNIRFCAAEIEHQNIPGIKALVIGGMAAGMNGAKINPICRSSLTYKIESQLDKAGNFYVTWDCNDQ